MYTEVPPWRSDGMCLNIKMWLYQEEISCEIMLFDTFLHNTQGMFIVKIRWWYVSQICWLASPN